MAYPVTEIANLLLRFSYTAEGAEDMMSNMKLQKMLYYEQGFHLACFGTPLFEEDIEAWMYGPVVPCVYDKYEQFGRNGIVPDMDSEFRLAGDELELFAQVYEVYGKYSAYGLMNLTHGELPWKSTPTGKGNIITKDKLKEYFKTQLS
ncbi:Panacea domain-containing protein [uncultured Muribaculum sp.]|uniref:Panacea domain-containing protein n=1 Tax=uncultured Muribaculum sp. TaxID=1918613 RepID=UPI0025F5DB93|nr:type II toxin-antitoxin system antitoxin SocA domain-containing protein [uncultured Muribaculum sp.]